MGVLTMEPRSSVRKSVSPALPSRSLRYRSRPITARDVCLCVPSMVTDMQTLRNELNCSCPGTLLTEALLQALEIRFVCVCISAGCVYVWANPWKSGLYVCLCCTCSCGCLYCVHTWRQRGVSHIHHLILYLFIERNPPSLSSVLTDKLY